MRIRQVAVTGAAGKTGRAVVGRLAAAGFDVVALVRRPEQQDDALAAGAARAATVDLRDGSAVTAALDGCDAVYHVPPNMHPEETSLTGTVVAAMQRAGAGRLVLHSVLAPYLPEMPHHLRKAEAERLVRDSALSWTILQPASYAQNVLGYLDEARATGELRVPYAVTAPFTPVDLADVAEAAAVVLSEDGHEAASYELAGPERLDSAAMADALGEEIDRPVRAVDVGLDVWRASAAQLPGQVRDDLAAMFGYYDRHGLVGSARVLEWLLGRPATTFAAVLRREMAADAGRLPGGGRGLK